MTETDDVEREHRRQQLHEPSRTLLGHVRHEKRPLLSGAPASAALPPGSVRALFGDERADYGQALTLHYQHGAPADGPSAVSVRMPVRTRGKMGPQPGPITCI